MSHHFRQASVGFILPSAAENAGDGIKCDSVSYFVTLFSSPPTIPPSSLPLLLSHLPLSLPLYRSELLSSSHYSFFKTSSRAPSPQASSRRLKTSPFATPLPLPPTLSLSFLSLISPLLTLTISSTTHLSLLGPRHVPFLFPFFAGSPPLAALQDISRTLLRLQHFKISRPQAQTAPQSSPRRLNPRLKSPLQDLCSLAQCRRRLPS